MSTPGQQREPLQIGEWVADVELTEKLGGGGGVHAWTGLREDGTKAVVFALDASLGMQLRDQFLAAAGALQNAAHKGVLPVVSVDPIAGAYVGDLDATGTLADLPLLSWDQKRVTTFFKQLCQTVAGLHDKGVVHGWLRPENVLLDGSLEPVVANPKVIDIGALCRTDAAQVWLHRVYTPPEVRHGGTADFSADAYALGRILQFALTGAEPDEKDERLPRLDSLAKDVPNALVRIVRKCTLMDPAERYTSAQELVADLGRVSQHIPVGTPHPDIDGKEESSMVDDELLKRSKPPPAKKQRTSGVVVEIEDEGPRFWSVGIAIGFGFIALLLLAIPIIAVMTTGTEAIAFDIILWSAALPIGLATPGFRPNRILARFFVMVAAAAVLFFSAPLDRIREGRTAGLQDDEVGERIAAIKELHAEGVREFRAVDLTGADISGMDLSDCKLEGMVLKNAKAIGTNFTNASMENVDMAGANISGANMRGTVGAFMRGLEAATCDDKTIMPDDYTCKEGSPLPSTP